MVETNKNRSCIAVVRIRGVIRASKQVRDTLQMLHLKRNNYAVLIDDRPSYLGMLQTVQNNVTWGEPSKETVNALIRKRGRLAGNHKLTDEYAQNIGHKSIGNLVEAVSNGTVEYWKLPNVQPFFKLHPPTKGFKGKIKKSYGANGELGYRSKNINDLIKRML